nr:MAG TPA: hypothetical protein [Caudoviricetes sp.]
MRIQKAQLNACKEAHMNKFSTQTPRDAHQAVDRG